MTTPKSPRGGRREGAGRKSSSGQQTVVKRIPESLVPAVDTLIAGMTSLQPKGHRLPAGALRLPETPSTLSIPFALEKIPAGFPSPAEPYIADYIDFNDYLVQNPAATFSARSGGQSMLDAGIDKNDIMLIDRSLTAKHNDIVMADLGNEFTIKRLHYLADGRIKLKSVNAAGSFPDFSPSPEDTWTIVGVVTFVIKDVRRK